MWAFRIWVAACACLAIACSASNEHETENVRRTGQAIHSSHAGPAPWPHVLTCYGGCSAPHYDSSACGHNTSCGPIADGSWWYATERAAFHCGAKLQLTRGDKCVVVDVQDNGPADWVESNSASKCGTGYIIDTSPLVADYFGGGCGWGECFIVDVTPVPDDTPTGPCSNCSENCGKFGCACVDGQCSGGYCPGTGCSAQETANCAAFGCGCVDHQCNGGWCDGTGCTAKETEDCAKFACNCVDHQCSGGYGCSDKGTGCTAKDVDNCSKFGCGCADHQCSGGACAPAPDPAEAGGSGGDGGSEPIGGDAGQSSGGAASAAWGSGGSVVVSKAGTGGSSARPPPREEASGDERCSVRAGASSTSFGWITALILFALQKRRSKPAHAPR